MADSVNMSLDEIIQQNKQNRASRSRGRGGGTTQSRGNIRGGGRGGGGGVRGRGWGRGRGRGRGRSLSRSGTPGPRQGRSRSRSRGPGGRSQSRSRSGSQARSRSRQQRRSTSQARSMSRSRSQLRGLTPKGRAGLEDQQYDMPPLVRSGNYNRGGWQNRLRRSNSNPNLQAGVHSRLGINLNRGAVNNHRTLAVAKRGISKRGRGLSTANRYSAVGLRSDQILKEQRQNYLIKKNMIKSQTFTRSRKNSFNASQLTVSVANDFAKRRRNSLGSANYLNKQSLAQLNNQFGGGYNTRRGPGSVKSVGSNRSTKSNRSNRSNQSNNSKRSTRSRGRGRGVNRGRGASRGIGRNFVSKQVLNPKLQKEIAALQGKSYGNNAEAPGGVNFSPTPASTAQTLHQRFAST